MRLSLLLVLLVVLSPAMALSINVAADDYNLTINGEVNIYYEISLNAPAEVNYTIGLLKPGNQIIIYNYQGLINQVNGSLDYNITNTEAGTYELYLQVISSSMNLTESAPDLVVINPKVNYTYDLFDKLYMINNTATGLINLQNTGNTKLSVTTYLTKAQSDLNINPQSFQLKPNETKTLTVTASKPEADYNATINFIFEYNTIRVFELSDVSIIVPVVNLTIDNIAYVQDGYTNVYINLTNQGNMDLNATLTIRTYTQAQGFNNYNYAINAPAGQLIQLNYTLPLSTLVSAKIIYEGLNGTVEVTRELSPISTLPFALTQDQMLVIIIVGLVIFIYIYFKITKRKKFR